MTGFRPDIEGLRGVAVLLVVGAHLTGHPRGGFLGVDVFFVLSGFLITGLLVAEGERTGRVSLRRFYARRVRRLAPVGVLVLVVTDIAAALLLLPSRAHATAVDSLWSLASLANVHFARLGTDYFEQTRPPSPVQHYWSLSVEEQFYFVWPTLTLLALVVAARRGWSGRRVLTALAASVVAGSFAWSVVSTASTPATAYFSAPARAWELGVGALLALLAPRVRSRPAVAAAGFLGLGVSVLVIGPETPVPGYAAALPSLATVALIWAAPAVLGVRPLRYVGRISYSLYLWHWPVVVLAADVPGGTSATGTAVAGALAFLLSVASYHLVEAPVRRSSWLAPRDSRSRRPMRGSWAPAAALVSVAVLVGAYVFTAPDSRPPLTPAPLEVAAAPDDKGAPRASSAPADARPAPPDLAPYIRRGLALSDWPDGLDDLRSAAAPEWIRDRCLDIGPRNIDKCRYGPATATRVAVVLGDSVAISWLPALRAAAERTGWRLQVLTRRQCPNAALPGGRTRAVTVSCANHQKYAAEQVLRLRPELLVMSNQYGGASADQWRVATTATFDRIAPGKAKVIVLSPPPETGNLQKCYTRLAEPSRCTRSISDTWRAFSAVERSVAARYGASFVDTSSWFCADGRCPAVVQGAPVHFDGKHLTAAYSRFLGPYVEQVLSRVR